MKHFITFGIALLPFLIYSQVSNSYKKIVVEDGGIYIEDTLLGHGTSRFYYSGFNLEDGTSHKIRSVIAISDFRKIWDSHLTYPAPGLIMIRDNEQTGDSFRSALVRGPTGLEFRMANSLLTVPLTKLMLSNEGNLGVGTDDPKAKLSVAQGDVYIENIGSGVIMKSPDGTCWRMTVSDAGDPVFTPLNGCP